jgi:hypothetical protein
VDRILEPTGVAWDGEVEDHILTIEETPVAFDVQPSSLTFSVEAGQVSRDTLVLSNLGAGDIEWTTREEALPTGGERGVARGFGGPDTFGYRWIDSSEPDGPVFTLDLPGTWQNLWLGDGEISWVDIPFPFPFYGETKTQIGITSDGYLTFASDSLAVQNACMPDADSPNDLIAVLWQDYELDMSGMVEYNDDSPDVFGVYYSDMVQPDPTYAMHFQVHLHSNGTMYFQYLLEDVTDVAVVGIESSDGSMGLPIACFQLYPVADNGAAIRIEDPCPWLVENPAGGVLGGYESTPVEIWVDGTDMEAGVYEGELVLLASHAARSELRIPVSLEVTATAVDDSPATAKLGIRGNRPNPFNPATVIDYELPTSAVIDLVVYDVSGRVVRTLERGVPRSAGPHSVEWNGCADDGKSVASGVYFCELSAMGEKARCRLTLLK